VTAASSPLISLCVPKSLGWARPPTKATTPPTPRYNSKTGSLSAAIDGATPTDKDQLRDVEVLTATVSAPTHLPAVDDIVDQAGDALPWLIGEWWKQGIEDPSEVEIVAAWWLFLLLVVRRKLQDSKQSDDPNYPLYVRAHFLLLSIPFRSQEAVIKGPQLSTYASPLAFEARRARETWAKQVDRLNDHSIAEVLTPVEIDAEIDRLLWADAANRNVLQIDARQIGIGSKTREANQPEPEQQYALESQYAFLKWSTRRLLLPRFRVGDSRRLVSAMLCRPIVPGVGRTSSSMGGSRHHGTRQETPLSLDKRLLMNRREWARHAPLIALALMAALAAWMVAGIFGLQESPLHIFGPDHQHGVRCTVIALAAAPYGFLLVASSFGGAEVSYPLLLRMPAVSVLGASVLLTLGTSWYASTHWWAIVAATGFALGYLMLEGRNHRVSRLPIRATGILLTALGHGICIGVLWLTFGIRIFLAPVECAAIDRAHPLCADKRIDWVQPEVILTDPALALSALLLTAAVGTMLGLIIQVLWDDRPVTYPLIHLGGN